MNDREPAGNMVTKRSRTGEVRVSGLSNQRAKQCDPRLQWHMFHSICNMYRKAKQDMSAYLDNLMIESGEKERIDTNILGPKDVRAVLPRTTVIAKERKEVTSTVAADSLANLCIIPEDFKSIQPRADQVWNCDEIGIDPNGKWQRIVCTYQW